MKKFKHDALVDFPNKGLMSVKLKICPKCHNTAPEIEDFLFGKEFYVTLYECDDCGYKTWGYKK